MVASYISPRLRRFYGFMFLTIDGFTFDMPAALDEMARLNWTGLDWTGVFTSIDYWMMVEKYQFTSFSGSLDAEDNT